MMSEALKELSIIKDHIIKFAVQHDAMFKGGSLTPDEALQLRRETVAMHDAACNAYDLLSDKLLNN